jgi:hypothetical protein
LTTTKDIAMEYNHLLLILVLSNICKFNDGLQSGLDVGGQLYLIKNDDIDIVFGVGYDETHVTIVQVLDYLHIMFMALMFY